MPNRSKRASLGEVADLLERWGRKHSLLADPYVEGLLNGLRTNSQLAYWVEQRAVEMLPMPNTTSVASDRRRVNLLNAFRNVMVFVPIAFTWAAISQATSAFARYTETGSSRIVNFFDFWENGYGALSPFWKLSNVALVDFLLLSFIIFLSIGISLLENRLEKNDKQEQAHLDSERLNLAIKIDQALLPYQKPTVQVVNRQVSQSIAQLNSVTLKLLAIVNQQKSLSKSKFNLKQVANELKSIKSSIRKLR
jgi:hypothetical protein